jgi:uncharacterized protein
METQTITYVAPGDLHAQGVAPGVKSRVISARDGVQTYAVALSRDDEVMTALNEFATRHGVTCGHFTAIGALRELRLAWYDLARKQYKVIDVPGQAEALSVIGDVGVANDSVVVHCHIVVGLADGTTRGGHLVHALTSPTLEVTFTAEPTVPRKSFDEYSGLTLMDLSD